MGLPVEHSLSDEVLVSEQEVPVPEDPEPQRCPRRGPAKFRASVAKPGPALFGRDLSSEDEARSLFDELAANDALFWAYVDDCCLARAHKMCAVIRAKGVFCEKIRADNANGTWCGAFGLSFVRPGEPGRFIHVGFHIAPLVRVATPGGPVERVLDPALCEGPASPEAWAAKLINTDSIRADGVIDPDMQKKEFTRLPHDVFERFLFWDNKDEDFAVTDELLARHRRDYETRGKKR